MKKSKFFIVAIVILLICGGVAYFSIFALANKDKDKISNGVYIDTVNVSGMTKAQATKAIQDYIADRKSKRLTIKVDDNTVVSTLNDLGYEVVENNIIEEAFMVGKSGNLLKRYKERKDIEEEGLVFHLEFSLDDVKVEQLVKDQCTAFDIQAKDATIKRENNEFIITDHVTGRKVVTDETVEKIKSTILTDWDGKNINMEAVVIDDVPQYTREVLEKIDTVLGSFQTSYSTSSNSRANNLATGAKFIDGTVLYPGETFSAYEHLSPFTVANGYSVAGAYSQGKVIDSIGGGICQVSTTLYNAVLRAELEIVERSPHSMSVGYVKPSMDAAIAGTYKDLKFKNNLETPIYIQSYTVGRTIIFNIYGEEVRDTENRTIEFVSEVTSTTRPPKDVITEDPTKPTTYKNVTQTAHIGQKAKLYKVIYENGKEVSRVLINTSNYAAAPAYVTIGTKEEEKPEKNEEKDKNKGKDKNKKPEKEENTGNEEDNEDIEENTEDNAENPELNNEEY
ncbi:vancomycin resistance protein YoaR [Mobilisporobacter senegalensis]|uniref:Vancomycin resistance protein YoaR n=1 Tax=Mobilisporobacter senegalensis TaxID=1329262 RepID=A0A3N1X582_9FIRM|nr:VanW family protein [Mobilisporobacter senegalensis]ROR21930.1 vancomycin resistance protein YoaR [Mobilisporobacter senegalensis]